MRTAVLVALVLTVAVSAAWGQPKKGSEPLIRGKTVAAWAKVLEGKEGLPRVQAINALVQAGPEARAAVPALIGTFRDKDATFLHPLAAVALARIGPDAVPALQKALADKEDAVRGGVALALGLIGEAARNASATLGKALEDKTAPVRFAAAQALGRIGAGARTALPALRKALEDEDSAVRVEAAAALWKVANEAKGLDVLKKALSDDNGTVVAAAVVALGEMGPAAKAAGEDLKKVAEKDQEALRRVQAAEAWYRVSKDGAAVALIEKELHQNLGVRPAAIAALGTLAGEAKSAGTLTGLLDDKDAAVRREAACALCEPGRKADAATAKALLVKLGDGDAGVRWWCALALAAGEAEIRKH